MRRGGSCVNFLIERLRQAGKLSAEFNRMLPTPYPDRRHLPRWKINNRVLYHLENQPQTHVGGLKDLSTAGASIYIDKPLQLGNKVKLTIRLSELRIVSVDSRLIWMKEAKNGFLMGVNFYNVSEHCHQLILDHAFELNHQQLVEHWFQGWA